MHTKLYSQGPLKVTGVIIIWQDQYFTTGNNASGFFTLLILFCVPLVSFTSWADCGCLAEELYFDYSDLFPFVYTTTSLDTYCQEIPEFMR